MLPCRKCQTVLRSLSRTLQRQVPRFYVPRHVRCLNTGVAGSDTPRCGEVKAEKVIGSDESLVNGEQFEETKNEQENEETEEEYLSKQKILKASLPFVHQHGWTLNAIAAGAEQSGLPGIAHGMFPKGGVELVFYFYRECNNQLSQELKAKVEEMKQQEQKLKTSKFIREAIEMRLRMNIPYIDKWSQAMAIQTLPQNAMEAWTNLGNLVDEIWYQAGDRSYDFNYYTKRASLAAVYKATEIYMVQDTSEDWQDTWQFLDRRLEDVASLGKNVGKAIQGRTVLSEAAYGMCVMTKNVLGMNSKFR